MNNLFAKVNQYLGQKSVTHHRELYPDSSYSSSLEYRIALAFSAGYYDAPRKSNSINWKLI